MARDILIGLLSCAVAVLIILGQNAALGITPFA
jgi:hypothetical protein